jgi:uncharacterized membrane protein YccF (DUF307 family)
MKLIGNILWWIFGGLVTAIEYFVASLILLVTIVGIPFAIQTFKVSKMSFLPFSYAVKEKKRQSNFLNVVMNIIWFCVGGLWIALTHLFFGVLLTITIIGIPFGKQHFKLAQVALFPFGKEIVKK